jgi:aryl-alcohol dehydrogenase-like predicted oxidoreductase
MKRWIGNQAVSSLGLGCWALGGPMRAGDQPLGWGEFDRSETTAVIHAALDHGITLFDTSDAYGAGQGERLLGAALKGRRHDVVIATKFGYVPDEAAQDITRQRTDAAYVRLACEASLKRLGTEWIDLYQLHLGETGVEDAAAIADELEALCREGKIRSFGWSTGAPERAASWQLRAGFAELQFEINVLRDAPEMLVLLKPGAGGVAGLCRGPLAMGLLSGKYTSDSRLPVDSMRGTTPDWMIYFRDGRPSAEFLERIATIRELLMVGGRTLAQGALCWLLARHPALIPIPGARSRAQLLENVGALAHGPLPDDIMRQLARLMAEPILAEK